MQEGDACDLWLSSINGFVTFSAHQDNSKNLLNCRMVKVKYEKLIVEYFSNFVIGAQNENTISWIVVTFLGVPLHVSCIDDKYGYPFYSLEMVF